MQEVILKKFSFFTNHEYLINIYIYPFLLGIRVDGITFGYWKRRSAFEDRSESRASENSWKLGKRCLGSCVLRLHF